MEISTTSSGRSGIGRGALLAGVFSLAMLAQRGRHDAGSAAAPLNAVSHWLWGDEALHRDDVTASHTLVGSAVHMASGLLWARLYGLLRRNRRTPDAVNAVTDAIGVSAVAATVDFTLTPHRFRPGFEHRLSTTSLVWVYGAFAAGLALGGLRALRR